MTFIKWMFRGMMAVFITSCKWTQNRPRLSKLSTWLNIFPPLKKRISYIKLQAKRLFHQYPVITAFFWKLTSLVVKSWLSTQKRQIIGGENLLERQRRDFQIFFLEVSKVTFTITSAVGSPKGSTHFFLSPKCANFSLFNYVSGDQRSLA